MAEAPDAADLPDDAPIRIFVGTDRSQDLAFRVLGRSIRVRTRARVEVRSLAGLGLPPPADPDSQPRTGFSFARFAIPALAGREGRAIYLDADMLVLADIRDLWTLPLGRARLACQEELPGEMAASAPVPGARRRKQCSVMVLDCARLDWQADTIIAGLGSRYSYDALMGDLCILDEDDVSFSVPVCWNSLEHLDRDTCLIHFTDMMTQPWIHAANPNGWVWTREVRAMLASGDLDMAFIEAEVALGYARPSLPVELLEAAPGPLGQADMARLQAIDARHGFRPHAGLASSGRSPGLGHTARRLVRRILRGARPA